METGQPVVGCSDFHYITEGCGGQEGEAENRQSYTLGLFDLVLFKEGYKFIVFPLYIYLKPADEVKYNEVSLLNTQRVLLSPVPAEAQHLNTSRCRFLLYYRAESQSRILIESTCGRWESEVRCAALASRGVVSCATNLLAPLPVGRTGRPAGS